MVGEAQQRGAALGFDDGEYVGVDVERTESLEDGALVARAIARPREELVEALRSATVRPGLWWRR